MKWLIPLFMLTTFAVASAQELDCSVTLNYDALSGTDRENVLNLGRNIQSYINNYRWTGDDFKGPKIKVTLNIYLLSASGGVYTAQAFIGSQRPIYKSNDSSPMVRIMDNAWQFTYTKDQSLYHDEFHFNALTGFIDYYMYIILGFDYDSYNPLGGTKFFQKASNIVAQGQNSDYPQGWQPGGSGTYSRYALVNDIISGKYEVFRKAFYDYEYNGIDMLTSQRDSAQVVIANALDKIANIVIQSGSRSALLKVFFDAKYVEIAESLKDYPDKGILQKLAIVDQAHQSTYAKYIN
ncbi:MAG: DUF4835 family protein [Bacteroidetes bacterium]|nr:DUF4835 family protein [Bacteroidota bacterium]MCL5737975.1 DUF4835 family protein [Bacteroidota bacterium]